MQGLIEFRKNNYTAAREEVLKVLKVAPDHLPSVLLAGAVEFALGSQAQAQLYLGRVLDRVSDHLYARKLLVASLAKSGELPRAIEVLKPGLKQAPEDGALMTLAGELYMQSNEPAKATEFFEKAAQLDPKNAEARIQLGMSRLAVGATDRALADLESATQLETDKYSADVMLIISYVKRRDYEQALKAAAKLEKKQPNNPFTYTLKAQIYLAKKDVAAARKQLQHALELQPTYIPAARNLTQLDLQDQNPQAGRRRFEAILEKDKNNAQALIALAEFGPLLGATQQEQIDWLERARKANPAAVQPQLMLARLYSNAGDTKKALELAQQAQAGSPNNAEALVTLGNIQLAAGDNNQALTTYLKLTALNPKSPDALYRLAGVHALSGNRTEAVITLKKALALKPDFVDAKAALVNLEIAAGHLPEAMVIAKQVQKQVPRSELGYTLEGDVLIAQKQYQQATKAYETAFAMGRSGTLAIKLHAAYTHAGKPQEADVRLARWLKDSPEDAVARLYIAEAGLKSGKYQDAIEQYEWLLRKLPNDVRALNNLAWAYHQVKDPRALQTAERAYTLKPDNAAVADTLGWILVEQANTKRGIEVLQKAVEAAPNMLEVRFHLAQALAKSGDKAQAITQLERIVAGDATFSKRSDAVALLKQLNH
jgi:putative PEP-CTERM system TPR-repeat lipoprotein